MTKPFTSLWRPRHLMDTYPRLGTSWSLATERPLPLAQMSPPSPWAISILQALARLQNKTRQRQTECVATQEGPVDAPGQSLTSRWGLPTSGPLPIRTSMAGLGHVPVHCPEGIPAVGAETAAPRRKANQR